ncbi:M10 family metallopeptidase C-terminal domain-containing protein [Candidatus Williamhamiltonella defendens]|uniref:M10 family metallopeptidase C-terminal domain-containing protein n=1 Tax=Candidatus Williamhamiltonella defendens TaxID=138072 RepID=UPI0015842ECA|nr:M10 family metallopeptidase C-terminal domain-containing protein [Candidatus Hamiltonella defensa]
MITRARKLTHKQIKSKNLNKILENEIKNTLTATYNWNGEKKYGQSVFLNFSFDIKKNPSKGSDKKIFGKPILFTQNQIQKVKLILQFYSDVANVHFNEHKEEDINKKIHLIFFNYIKITPKSRFKRGAAYLPSRDGTSPIWINAELEDNLNPNSKNLGNFTLNHEIGHALGLRHSHISKSYTNKISVMSYYKEFQYNGYYPSGPQMYDIASVQYLYGANLETRIGNTIYGFNSNSGRPYLSAENADDPLIFCVWDAGGIDTFDFSGYRQNQRINLKSSQFSDVGGLKNNVSIAYRVIIENAISGSGDDEIIGNEVDNVLRGGKGADLIYGEQGCDRLFGEEGNDRLYGGEGADKLVGGRGSDQLWGGKDNDYLLGGEDQDFLFGGPGRDIFVYQTCDDSSTLSTDTICDFEVGIDKIDLSRITNNIKNIQFVDRFHFKGQTEIQQRHNSILNITYLMIDFSDSIEKNSLNNNDMMIKFTGNKKLTANDFIFSRFI